MIMFIEWLNYMSAVIQDLIDLITSFWLTKVFFGLSILYLLINAVKLKNNTD